MAVFLANDRSAFAGGQLVVQDELSYSHARNEERQLQTFKKPIFDAATGEPDFLICMSVDLTDRKRAEEALQESYASAIRTCGARPAMRWARWRRASARCARSSTSCIRASAAQGAGTCVLIAMPAAAAAAQTVA